jgi:hypothetical protein
MTQARYYARAGGDPALIAAVARELQTHWDPQNEFEAPDGERRAASHAAAVLGMLATDGSTNAVKGYLRRAEVAALGLPRTTSEQRGELAQRIWRMLVDRAIASAQGDGAADNASGDHAS